jgi:hypothetical protein
MHKITTKSNETLSKWYKNKHGASKIMDTFDTYHDSKRSYLCSIVGFMPLFNLGGVTEISKVVDVLLPLGRKQHSCVQGHSFCLHYTLCLMQLSVVRNLILVWCSDDIPVGELLVIDAVGWRSMYFVVMPIVNLIVILVTYAR